MRNLSNEKEHVLTNLLHINLHVKCCAILHYIFYYINLVLHLQIYNCLCWKDFLWSKQSCIQLSKVRSDRALPLKYFSKLFHIYQLKNLQLYLRKCGICNLWGELRSYYHVFQEVWLVLTCNKSDKFHHLYSSHLLAGTTKHIFLAGNGGTFGNMYQ